LKPLYCGLFLLYIYKEVRLVRFKKYALKATDDNGNTVTLTYIYRRKDGEWVTEAGEKIHSQSVRQHFLEEVTRKTY